MDRRTLLKGAATAPALAAGALAGASVLDANLIEKGREFRRLCEIDRIEGDRIHAAYLAGAISAHEADDLAAKPFQKVSRCMKEICNMPAHTAEGMKVKADVIAYLYRDEDGELFEAATTDFQLARSIVRDLLALT